MPAGHLPLLPVYMSLPEVFSEAVEACSSENSYPRRISQTMTEGNLFFFFFFLQFYFIFKLYIIVLVLPNIKMNPPSDPLKKWCLHACSFAESCPTLCDPMDCSPPGSSMHGIFQSRVLEWGAIAFSVNCS